MQAAAVGAAQHGLHRERAGGVECCDALQVVRGGSASRGAGGQPTLTLSSEASRLAAASRCCCSSRARTRSVTLLTSLPQTGSAAGTALRSATLGASAGPAAEGGTSLLELWAGCAAAIARGGRGLLITGLAAQPSGARRKGLLENEGGSSCWQIGRFEGLLCQPAALTFLRVFLSSDKSALTLSAISSTQPWRTSRAWGRCSSLAVQGPTEGRASFTSSCAVPAAERAIACECCGRSKALRAPPCCQRGQAAAAAAAAPLPARQAARRAPVLTRRVLEYADQENAYIAEFSLADVHAQVVSRRGHVGLGRAAAPHAAWRSPRDPPSAACMCRTRSSGSLQTRRAAPAGWSGWTLRSAGAALWAQAAGAPKVCVRAWGYFLRKERLCHGSDSLPVSHSPSGMRPISITHHWDRCCWLGVQWS